MSFYSYVLTSSFSFLHILTSRTLIYLPTNKWKKRKVSRWKKGNGYNLFILLLLLIQVIFFSVGRVRFEIVLKFIFHYVVTLLWLFMIVWLCVVFSGIFHNKNFYHDSGSFAYPYTWHRIVGVKKKTRYILVVALIPYVAYHATIILIWLK